MDVIKQQYKSTARQLEMCPYRVYEAFQDYFFPAIKWSGSEPSAKSRVCSFTKASGRQEIKSVVINYLESFQCSMSFRNFQ